MQALAFLQLLQLASPTLPVGAYSYSEGLETLCTQGKIGDRLTLTHWLQQELSYGAVRLEAAVLVRAMAADINTLKYWNNWLSATRESAELRASSWQMGTSLVKLMMDILPKGDQGVVDCKLQAVLDASYPQGVCNFAIAFGIAAAIWQIDQESAVMAYLHSWATNLIGAGVKLIPLGQTTGQQILLTLSEAIALATPEILGLADQELESCNWGLALASMQHENLYSRLFRS